VSTAICDTISAEQLDMLVMTEMWHQTVDDLLLKQCVPLCCAIIDSGIHLPDGAAASCCCMAPTSQQNN